jgi:hypothetical protein
MMSRAYCECWSTIPTVGVPLTSPLWTPVITSPLLSSIADVASKDGERLLRRVEFNAAADLSKCLRVARRRTADPKAAPQIQLIYGQS